MAFVSKVRDENRFSQVSVITKEDWSVVAKKKMANGKYVVKFRESLRDANYFKSLEFIVKDKKWQ